MDTHEVFPNPTVKQVIYQICFPSLFYLEAKIGEFQVNILNRFPQSALLFRQGFVLGIGTDPSADELKKLTNSEMNNVEKIWQFKTNDETCQLNVLNNSLDITSSYYKTYASGNSEENFRDMIDFVVTNFLRIAPIPVFTRIGLRYIDECPLPPMSQSAFKKWYNSAFPLNRFKLSETKQMDFVTVLNRGEFGLRYAESLDQSLPAAKFKLDFDGFAQNIKTDQYLSVTDRLHKIIHDEYEATIKEPVKTLMRIKK